MTHTLHITIYFENKIDLIFLEKVVTLFDPKRTVDLNSDDYVTYLPKTFKGMGVVVNLKFGNKNYKESVFDLMVKANKINDNWSINGPLKLRKYMFRMILNTQDISEGVNGIHLTLFKE
ncbi:hypothetical protein [Aquimarina litoralis]|uniref:hypothetical protein n=1 Tax=Aquimarina litoralis TaxID=584605 RepID=UPI001C5A3E7B|nr:hypothetical protein [Aquimarina litoralis]MBW1295635.1 hypothetical protein [Aquimarina litoralis]